MSLLDAGHAAAMEAVREMAPYSPDGATQTPATPAGSEQAPEAATPEDSFTKLDPNALPPEVQPYYKSMQADYTRKQQEVAPFRTLAEETGLDVDGLRQAAELYSALQDPQQLVQFHTELSTALQQQGLTPAEASAAATQHIAETQTGATPAEQNWSDDPEERRIQDLESRLAQFEQAQAAQAETMKREQMQVALVSEMNRQESLVKEAHPDWTQSDIDGVYELSAFYGGNLIDASNRYDEIVSDRIARILNGKAGVAANTAMAPLPNATATSRPNSFGGDLDAAHKAAMQLVRSMPAS